MAAESAQDHGAGPTRSISWMAGFDRLCAPLRCLVLVTGEPRQNSEKGRLAGRELRQGSGYDSHRMVPTVILLSESAIIVQASPFETAFERVFVQGLNPYE